MTLTDFQMRILRELGESFERDQIAYEVSYDGGPREVAIVLKVQQYVLWIYPDEANIEGPNLDKRFEWPDFDSSEDLASNYIKSVKRVIGLN